MVVKSRAVKNGVVKNILFLGLLFGGFFMGITSSYALEVLENDPKAKKTKPDQQQVTENAVTEDATKLAEILADTLTYEANFKQSVFREESDKAEITTGRFLIQRPNHFRWQTSIPFEQAIIADGKYLWTYDPELEQVTIQNQQSVLADSPLLLLTSSVESLVEAFEITQVEMKDKTDKKQQLYALLPKQNSLFESVHILIEGRSIKEFFLVDTLGGRTSVEFSDVKVNAGMDVKEFIFVTPEGVDVIDSREVE